MLENMDLAMRSNWAQVTGEGMAAIDDNIGIHIIRSALLNQRHKRFIDPGFCEYQKLSIFHLVMIVNTV